ncbi:MAG: T9SS type A sorting domain-containing protein [Bacteroidota bacterium]
MKKVYFLFFVLVLAAIQLKAQTTLYSNGFETYTVGGKIAQQAGAPWTTWSNAPGGAEDAAISSTQAYNSTKSIYVVNANDLVLKLGGKITGRYAFSWRMYVESGKCGYFNMLNSFASTNSIWALQAYIYNDSIYMDAGGAAVVKTTFTANSWHYFKVIVDLDDDFATVYMDSVESVSYKWSSGTGGNGTLLKMDAVNFYGWNGASAPSPTTYTTSGYFVDDVKLDSISAPQAPSNLTAIYTNPDIAVAWTAPTTPPDHYKLSRNGKVILSTTALSFTDLAPWANTYIYAVRAAYAGEGYSHSSNPDTATVPGGVERNLVLFEGGTGTWCTYCPGAAMGLRDLIEVNNKKAVAIEYHSGAASGDIYEIPVAVERINFYGITGFPTEIADGVLYAVGGSATATQYPTYLGMYNERTSTPSFHNISCSIVPVSFENYQATITITESFKAFANGLKLQAALTESNIPEVWQNQTELDYVCRGMYPDELGTNLDFSTTNTQSVTLNFSTTGFVKNNCEFVVFVQHTNTKLVTQTLKVDISSIVGMEELQGQKLSIYPNPASDYVQVLSNGKGDLNIYDMTGKLVLSSKINSPTEVIDISKLSKGIYILRTINGDKVFTEKLVVE